MSIWADIRKKSLGVEDRQEEYVAGKCVIDMKSERGEMSSYGEVKFDEAEKYMGYRVHWEVMDKFCDGYQLKYSYYTVIVLKNGIDAPKGLINRLFNDMMASMENRLGEWDGLTGKDGKSSWSRKNGMRLEYIKRMVHVWNCVQMGVQFQEDLDSDWYDYIRNCLFSDIVVKYGKYVPDYEEYKIIK